MESTGPSLSPPMDLSHHYSRTTVQRQGSEMKSFYKYFQIPGIGNLAGGLPNDSLFPFDTLEAQVAKPERWTPTPNEPGQVLTVSSTSGPRPASHITVPKKVAEANPFKKIDLSTALQYGTAEGYPPLRSFIRQFTRENLHPTVPYLGGPEVILTCGSTDGFSKVAEMIVEPWFPDRDDVKDRPGMLCEAFVYSGPLAAIKPKGVQVVAVEYDEQGMLASGPGGLEEVLTTWDYTRGRLPHFLYTVTMGHNPTGGILSVRRRREIYSLCSKFDIIIIEDDPYWYLQYPSAVAGEAQSRNRSQPQATESYRPQKSSGYEFLDSLVPSYLSIDTDGRVIRLDTFSKTVAPGCRLGWVTAQPKMIERLNRITEVTTQQPSGFVQSMVAEMIMGSQPEATATFRALSRRDKSAFAGWNMDGWVRWLEGLRGVYERRMTTMCTILDEHSSLLKQTSLNGDGSSEWDVITKTQLLSFSWPQGGMFIWAKVLFETHPLWQAKGNATSVIDGFALATAFLNFLCRKPCLVLPAPGSLFAATPEVHAERAWGFVRLCFAAVTEEDVTKCSQRFGKGMQDFWKVTSVEEMEELIEGAFLAEMTSDVLDIGFGMGC
ncbi:hypothetical protein S40285_04911 [Stachybotrys chlorohalonatus IBT 40285]|uniref:Aminotransferase class I/classII large domain-containing protein n=1 Tax=Stachybotrys chlorohalonatus (strain IBT 40285) TaxID=1283841 RepID=A0A084QGY2_STAC4|nr:hypothetical protein S40285_04911 [Stachybotrys chlorohalonata IBT 40285]